MQTHLLNVTMNWPRSVLFVCRAVPFAFESLLDMENKQKERQYCYTNGTFSCVFTNLTVEELRDEWKITCSVFCWFFIYIHKYFYFVIFLKFLFGFVPWLTSPWEPIWVLGVCAGTRRIVSSASLTTRQRPAGFERTTTTTTTGHFPLSRARIFLSASRDIFSECMQY